MHRFGRGFKIATGLTLAVGCLGFGLQDSPGLLHPRGARRSEMEASSVPSPTLKAPSASSSSSTSAAKDSSDSSKVTATTSDVTEGTPENATKVFYTVNSTTGEVILDPQQYKRIDEEYMQLDRFKAFQNGNALHDTLNGLHRLEKYHVYKNLHSDEIVAVVRFGDMVNGHPTIVHGGITSLVFDNTFGWLFFSLDLPMAVTANLNVNYRSPLPQNTTCILHAKLKKLDGRKMFMEATLHDLSGKLVADSTSLFISLKPLAAAAAKLQMKIKEYL
jgi:acyl-coenzyme A thioesterase PaaI-like protein